MRLAAVTTAKLCSRPGMRVSRSIGPEIETAAIIFPLAPRIGALTDATPGSRSPSDCAQPRLRTPDKSVAVNVAPCQAAV